MKDDLTLDDYFVICGDFGILWTNDATDKFNIEKVYGNFPCTILWVDGNHENFDKLYAYPTEMWKGGKIHRISDRIFHLQRGEIFELNNKFRIFAFGGARSTDRGYDTGNNKFWWPLELPTCDEMQNALINLEKVNNKVDYIFTHDCCSSVLKNLYLYGTSYKHDFNDFLEQISLTVQFKKWFFGHHHYDVTLEKYQCCLYNSIIEVMPS